MTRIKKHHNRLSYLNFPIFKNLTPEDFNLIELNHKIITYKKGETIIKQGTPASYLVCVLSGIAKWYIELKEKEFIIQLFKTDEIVGFQASLGEMNYMYSLAAIESTTVCLIEKKIFKTILARNNKFNADFIAFLAAKGSYLIRRTISIAHKQLNGKIADVLLYLHSEIYNSANPFPLILSKQDLADMAATSKESVIRVLKELKDSKVIKIDSKMLEIIQLKKLTEISEYG